jgi:hypothetical protein
LRLSWQPAGLSTTYDIITEIHVLPGRVYHEKKVYTHLVDREDLTHSEGPDFLEIAQLALSEDQYYHREISVKESATAIECLLSLRPSLDKSGPKILISPA